LNLTRASNSSTRLNASEKKNEKIIQSSHTHRASYQFSIKPESQNSSSRYRELHNQAQALMQAKKKMKEKNQTFHNHKASCLVQLQSKVTKFKLSLPRAS
jgi:hypothetical protein